MIGKAVGIRGDAGDVEPQQVGRVARGDAEVGTLARDGITHKALVLIQVGAEGIEPRRPFGKRRDGGGDSKRVRLRDLIGVEPARDAVTERRVGGDGTGGLEPREVECLGGGDERHAVLPAVVRNGGERRIGTAGVGEITMDLVRDDEDMMLFREGADPRERLAAPDLAHRVVRVAEDQHGGLGVGEFALQIRKVDVIDTPLITFLT